MCDSLYTNINYVPNRTIPNRNGNNYQQPQVVTPQHRSTEEFKAYLKEHDPKTYAALEYFAEKYPPRQLSPKEREEMNNTCLKSFRAPSPKTMKTFWQKIEAWLLTKTKRPPRTSLEDIREKYNTYIANNN